MKKIIRLWVKEDERLFNLLLVAVLVVAFVLRFPGIFSGLFGDLKIYANPDETGILGQAFGIIRTADYNPHGFTYPSLLTYMEVFFQTVVYLFSVGIDFPIREFENTVFPAAHLYAIGRLLITILGTATVWVLYHLTRRISNSRVALAAAGILAVTFTHIWSSQYAVTDVPVTLLGLTSIYFSLRILTHDSWKNYLGAALFIGLAIGTKYNAFTYIVPFATAHFIINWESNRKLLPFRFWEKFFSPKLVVSLAFIPLVYLLTTPFTILDLEKFIQDYTAVVGSNSRPMHIQLTDANGIPSWLWYILYSATSGLYYPVFFVALFGLIRGVFKLTKEKLVILSYVVINYFVISQMAGRMDRWAINMYPLLAIFGALFLYDFGVFTFKKKPLIWSLLGVFIYLSVLGATFGLSAFRAVAYNYAILQPDTRIRASQWIADNIKSDRYIFSIDNSFPDLYLKMANFTNLHGATILGDRALKEIKETKEGRYVVLNSGYINIMNNLQNSEIRLLPYYDSQSYKELFADYQEFIKGAQLVKEVADPYFKSGFFGPPYLEQSSTVTFWRNPAVLIYYLPGIQSKNVEKAR